MLSSPPISIAIINFNGIDKLEKTLQAVDRLAYPNIAETIVIDDGSTDGSQYMVSDRFPNVRLVEMGHNQGAATARNIALDEASHNLVFLLDNDIYVEPNCLSYLIKVKKLVPSAGAVHPTIIDRHDPSQSAHYNGGYIHYLCAFIPKQEVEAEYEIYDVVSGGALLIDKTFARRIGGFDEDYVFNWEDGDFTFRLTLAGYPCINVAKAKVYHSAVPRLTSKAYYQVRNRLFFIIKMYNWRTILLSAPALILYEFSQFCFMLAKGAGKDCLAGIWAAIRHLPVLLRKRRSVQQVKIANDHDVLHSGDLYIPPQLLNNPIFSFFKRLYVGFFDTYWLMIRRFV